MNEKAQLLSEFHKIGYKYRDEPEGEVRMFVSADTFASDFSFQHFIASILCYNKILTDTAELL